MIYEKIILLMMLDIIKKINFLHRVDVVIGDFYEAVKRG